MLTALVCFALTAWSDYWRSLALDWLEAGWPLDATTSDALVTAKAPDNVRARIELISRRDPAGLGPRVAIGEQALDELADETTDPL